MNNRSNPSASNRVRTSSDGQKYRAQNAPASKKAPKGRIQTRNMPQHRPGNQAQGQGRIQPREMSHGDSRSSLPDRNAGIRTTLQAQQAGSRSAALSAGTVNRSSVQAQQAAGRNNTPARNSAVIQGGAYKSSRNSASSQMRDSGRNTRTQKNTMAQSREKQNRTQYSGGGANYSARTRNVPLRNEYAEDGTLRNQAELRDRDAGARPKKARYFYDYSLLFAVIFIFALGLLIIYSSSQYMAALEKQGNSSYYFMKQLTIGSAGLVGAIILSLLDYRWLKNFCRGIMVKFAYAASIVFLIITLVSGLASHGKARWIVIAGFNFQPAEVAKVGLILALALFISNHGPATKEWRNLWKAIGLGLLPTLLILKQNISSAVIVALICAVMIFVAVDDVKSFVFLGTLGLTGVFATKPLLRMFIEKTGYTTRPEKYYLRRIFGWAAPEIFPDDAYQTQQSLYAIGSGGMTGHGLGESIQKFGKIPEVQNDMIFAILCEEFGFIGAATLIVLFIYIIYRIYKIAINASDLFGTMICTGVMAHLGTQVVLNIAVVTGVIPNTGVTLPFISYGGSALLLTMAEIGLVLSVAHKIELGER